MRVFELAKKLGLSSKDLMAVLVKMHIQVKSHMSALTDDDVQAILKKEGHLRPKGSAKKLGKGVAADAASAAPPKRRFVLRKRRPAPPAAPEEAATEQSPVASLETGGAPELAPAPPLQDTPPVEGSAPEKPRAMSERKDVPLETSAEPLQANLPGSQVVIEAPSRKQVSGDSGAPDAATAAPVAEKESPSASSQKTEALAAAPEAVPEKEQVQPPPVSEAVSEPEKKKDKKKGKSEPDLAGKAAFPPKQKEKPRRGRQFVWDRAKEGGAEENAADARKWKDFKPFHRREDRKSARKSHGPVIDVAKPRKKVIKIYEGLTVKDFSELIGQKVPSIIAKLMDLGKMATINQLIGLDEAALIADAFDVHAEVVAQKTEEEILMQATPDDPDALLPRPPVITIMGHVDHGKTSLLDAIRKTNVTQGEAGGITQHIGAYMVETGGRKITFLDTPGHEAFTAMRARGANVTDIVILVVAADDGVMPQTVEAIKHAKLAGVPIIIAINKMDRPDANPDRVKQALTEYELVPEEWGGETIFVEVSAVKKTGLAHLLEMIDLQAEVLELKANPKKSMVGAIIEARLEKGRGPVATVLVREGTLKVGMAFVTGSHFGKVRALINDQGKKVKQATPSMPVEVIGLNGVPEAGDSFVAVKDERVAKGVAGKRFQDQRTSKLSQVSRVTLDELYQGMEKGERKDLNVIIKADVQGSLEALKESLQKLSTDAVKLHVLHGGVGGITESDVLLAAASGAIVIGFNIRSESKVKHLAEKEQVDLRTYNIIYDVISDLRAAMEGLLAPTLKERVLGQVEVRQTFSVPKQGTIAGGYVREGIASRNCAGVRVLRNQAVVFEGKLASLRRFKDDVKEVQTGYECGIGIEGFNDVQVGDMLELYTFDEVATKLESA